MSSPSSPSRPPQRPLDANALIVVRTHLLNVADAEGCGSFDRAGESGVVGPACIRRERGVLAAVGDRDVARITRVAEGVEGKPIRRRISAV